MSSVVFLNAGISDHSPCLVSVFEDYWKGPKPFKYCGMWGKDTQFQQIVCDSWNQDVSGCLMYKVVKKLQMIKSKLKGLHKLNYNNLTGRLADAEKTLKSFQENL